MSRLRLFLISLSKRLNAALGNEPDMTFCAYVYLRSCGGGKRWVVLRNIIDLIFWFDPDHCKDSFFNGH